MTNLFLDHIVLAVPNLEETVSFLKNSLGIHSMMGGKHVGIGTHNAIVGLGQPEDLTYLELLAIDPEDNTHYDTYPLGLSQDMKEPFIATWCIRCESNADIEQVNHQLSKMGKLYQHGPVRKMQRITPEGKVLSWKLANSLEQTLASSGQIPFLIQWDNLELHPSNQIPRENFYSYSLRFSGPATEGIQENLQFIGLNQVPTIAFNRNKNANKRLKLHGKNISWEVG